MKMNEEVALYQGCRDGDIAISNMMLLLLGRMTAKAELLIVMADLCVGQSDIRNHRYTGRWGHKALSFAARLSLKAVLTLTIRSLLIMT